jgi:UDP-N-acetylmuramoyl-tripeptide--D-alanyl-D-alanine ligase
MKTIPDMVWSAADVESATGGRMLSGDRSRRFSGIGIDSRTLGRGGFFVAIVGQTHDGHRFVESVVEQGAAGVLINLDRVAQMPLSKWQQQHIVSFGVSDTTRALGDLGRYHRNRSGASVVAITGSSGKTSTREMTAAVVGERFQTLTSLKNFNNEIGVPLTMLRLEPTHRWVVAELGMSHFGEIRRLGEICRPDIGVITNIGPAHLAGVGSLDGVMAAKGELLEALGVGGVAVLNADDPRCLRLASGTDREVLLYGVSEKAPIRAEAIREAGRETRFTLVLPVATTEVSLQTPGRFMVLNALAAAAVGYRLGIPIGLIRAGLERFRPVEGRARVLDTALGIHVINDTYNANPGSMAAAVAMLKTLGKGARCFFAMGDMRELGPESVSLHRGIGSVIAGAGVYRLGAVGDFSAAVAEGACAAGMSSDRILTGGQADILADFKQHLLPGDWILVKGSRSMGMEKIVTELMNWAGGVDRPTQTKE